jgi:predicted ATP-binding protein involved in virulence
MRIEHIRIKNFKGFEEAEFRFPSMFTVIIGNNATGKTSVLDALAVGVGCFLMGIDGAVSRSIDKREIRTVWHGSDPRYQTPVEIECEGTVFGKPPFKWKRSIRKIEKRAKNITSDAKPLADLAAEAHTSYRKGLQHLPFPVIAYHGTGRLWYEHSEKTDYSKQDEGVLMSYLDCLSPRSSSKAFLTWYKTFSKDADNARDKEAQTLIHAFNDVVSKLIPQWHGMAYHFGMDELTGFFTDDDGKEQRMLFSQLSDGYRNMIGMAADIAYRCIKLNGHLGAKAVSDTPGIVLIDELDLHLHPKWQREVVSRLMDTFPRIQFIATTHSPFIVQSLKAEQLINLDRVTDTRLDDLTINQISEDVMGIESSRSAINAKDEQLSTAFLKILESGQREGDNEVVLDGIEAQVADPAVRAFLKMRRLSGHG